MGSKLPLFLLVVVVLITSPLLFVRGDVYLQSPRGSNNKLSETSNNRNNANRLFDSQNNANGGYQVGDNCNPVCSDENTNTYDRTIFGAGKGTMYYYVGSILPIEWTAQHGCGTDNGKTSCEFILQYMCDPRKDVYGNSYIRNGQTTNTIPNNAASAEVDNTFGRHESYEYYQTCTARERNKGLFLADQFTQQQLQQRTTAIYTRQDVNGNRHGFECPEERDYYPYWHPSPWKDIAVFTDDTTRCNYYKQESQNVAPKGECSRPAFNMKQSCEASGGTWSETSFNIDPPLCLPNVYTRDNHLGNARSGEMQGFNWTIPDEVADACVLRVRYNISTNDYKGWGKEMVTSSDNNERSPIKDQPVDDWLGLGEGVSGPLRLSINTDEISRTFQDRSHVFQIKARPDDISKSANIYNLNVRGRRGNIVQVYPAVEYDFVPNNLVVTEGDYIHFQWTGSDANNNNNAGEGRDMTDRSNIVQISDPNTNVPIPFTTSGELKSMFGDDKNLVAKMAYLGQAGCNNAQTDDDAVDNCKLLNAAPGYFDAGLIKMKVQGTFHYLSTRNHQFSNRSQKGTIVVLPLIPAFAIALLVIGAVGISAAAAAFALTKGAAYVVANPTSKLATSCCGAILVRRNKVNPEPEEKIHQPSKRAEWWAREKYRVIFLGAYAICNIGIFFYGFIKNLGGPSPYFPMAKGGGALLNFNCSLILFPVLRNMISWLRLTPLSEVIPLDDNITFHKIIASVIALALAIHMVGHYLNYSVAYTNYGTSIAYQGWGTFAGLTGHILLILMVIIFITAATPIKRKTIKIGKKKIGGYDIFWSAHHAYIPVLVVLWLHGPVFWMWSFYPILMFIAEKFIRRFRSQEKTQLVKIIKLSSDVMCIQMRKRDFRYKAGQYVYLNCPEISKSEWHPFTITSAPEESHFSVHIRCRGDWTSSLRSLLNPNNLEMVEYEQKALRESPRTPKEDAKLVDGAYNGAAVLDVSAAIPVLMTDGPYGSASEHVFEYDVVMLVGAGIGVTPFASIMRSMSLRQQAAGGANSLTRPKKVYFYWVCGDEQEFNWFKFLLQDIETDPVLSELVSLNTFLTGEVNLHEIVNKVQKGQAKNINMKYAGRPNWRRIFKEQQKAHPTDEIGVFLCGPIILAKELSNMCATNSTGNGTRFVFRKENF